MASILPQSGSMFHPDFYSFIHTKFCCNTCRHPIHILHLANKNVISHKSLHSKCAVCTKMGDNSHNSACSAHYQIPLNIYPHKLHRQIKKAGDKTPSSIPSCIIFIISSFPCKNLRTTNATITFLISASASCFMEYKINRCAATKLHNTHAR